MDGWMVGWKERRRMLIALYAGIACNVNQKNLVDVYNTRLIDEKRPSHLHGFMHFLFDLFNL